MKHINKATIALLKNSKKHYGSNYMPNNKEHLNKLMVLLENRKS